MAFRSLPVKPGPGHPWPGTKARLHMIKQGVLVRTNGKIEPIEIRNEEDMQAAIGLA